MCFDIISTKGGLNEARANSISYRTLCGRVPKVQHTSNSRYWKNSQRMSYMQSGLQPNKHKLSRTTTRSHQGLKSLRQDSEVQNCLQGGLNGRRKQKNRKYQSKSISNIRLEKEPRQSCETDRSSNNSIYSFTDNRGYEKAHKKHRLNTNSLHFKHRLIKNLLHFPYKYVTGECIMNKQLDNLLNLTTQLKSTLKTVRLATDTNYTAKLDRDEIAEVMYLLEHIADNVTDGLMDVLEEIER